MNERKEQSFALLNAWTTCDTSQIAGFIDPGFVEIDRPQAEVTGLSGLREKIEAFHKVHRDVNLRVIAQIASDDVVCTEWLMFAKVADMADPDGEKNQLVQIAGISWTYFAGGKIVKNRVYRDIVGYLMQRGYRWTPPEAKQESAQ
jgi:hypothetical protein